MTDEEAMALKSGDVVGTWVGGRRVIVAVTTLYSHVLSAHSSPPRVHVRVFVRRLHATSPGGPRPKMIRRPDALWRVPEFDAQVGNVFADWLEDNGEPRAAAKLREAFPLVTREGEGR